jgi:hypothetical protein
MRVSLWEHGDLTTSKVEQHHNRVEYEHYLRLFKSSSKHITAGYLEAQDTRGLGKGGLDHVISSTFNRGTSYLGVA